MDLTFLRGVEKEELSKLINGKDPRIMEILKNPELKRKLYMGELTKPLEEKSLEVQVAEAKAKAGEVKTSEQLAKEGAEAKVEKPAEGEDPFKSRGFKSQEGMLKTFDNQADYIKRLESQRDELNARAGAEGGPLGQKVQSLTGEIESLKRMNEDLMRRIQAQPLPQAQPTNKEILENYMPILPDINPADFADPEFAKLAKRQQDEIKKSFSTLLGKVNQMSAPSFNKEFTEMREKNRKLEEKLSLLVEKDELRERQVQTEKSEGSFKAVYSEADGFIKNKLGLKPTRSFEEIDKAIAYHRANDQDGGNGFFNNLPEIDREAWQTTIGLIGRYGSVQNGQFIRYPNVESLEDIYNLSLLKTGKLEKDMQEKILRASRDGAQSVLNAQGQIGASARGLDSNNLKGEQMPVDMDMAAKQARLKVLMELEKKGELLKDRKLYDEYRTLVADVRNAWKSSLVRK